MTDREAVAFLIAVAIFLGVFWGVFAPHHPILAAVILGASLAVIAYNVGVLDAHEPSN